MLTQLMRYLCNCLPGRSRTQAGEAPPRPAPRGTAGASDIPYDLQPLLEIPGIGPKTVRYLHEAGYSTVADVRAASEVELSGVDGIGPRAAATIKKALAT